MDARQKMTEEQIAYSKAEIVHTTTTPGWKLIVQLLEHAVKDIEEKCFQEEDEAKGAALRREAKAAREFKTNFLTAIQAWKNADTEATTVTFE